MNVAIDTAAVPEFEAAGIEHGHAEANVGVVVRANADLAT